MPGLPGCRMSDSGSVAKAVSLIAQAWRCATSDSAMQCIVCMLCVPSACKVNSCSKLLSRSAALAEPAMTATQSGCTGSSSQPGLGATPLVLWDGGSHQSTSPTSPA